jgi:hypothetical protein
MNMRGYDPAERHSNDRSSSNRAEEDVEKRTADIFISENSESHPETERNHHPRRKTSSVYSKEVKNSPVQISHSISCHQTNVSVILITIYSHFFLGWLGMHWCMQGENEFAG